jgi:hypothetical protein
MPLEPILPTAIRWGCATTLIGPLVLYSLVLQIARWTSWDLASPANGWGIALTPYLAFKLPLLILASPFTLLAISWTTFRMWFAVSSVYFIGGALLPVGIDRLVEMLDKRQKTAGPEQTERNAGHDQ